jgi:hypothetical protein
MSNLSIWSAVRMCERRLYLWEANMNEVSERGDKLREERRHRLARAHDRYGLRRLLAAIDVAEGTYWRARAGGRIYHGTEVAIDQGLTALEREAP